MHVEIGKVGKKPMVVRVARSGYDRHKNSRIPRFVGPVGNFPGINIHGEIGKILKYPDMVYVIGAGHLGFGRPTILCPHHNRNGCGQLLLRPLGNHLSEGVFIGRSRCLTRLLVDLDIEIHQVNPERNLLHDSFLAHEKRGQLPFSQLEVAFLTPYTTNNTATKDQQHADMSYHRADDTGTDNSPRLTGRGHPAHGANTETGRQKHQQRGEPTSGEHVSKTQGRQQVHSCLRIRILLKVLRNLATLRQQSPYYTSRGYEHDDQQRKLQRSQGRSDPRHRRFLTAGPIIRRTVFVFIHHRPLRPCLSSRPPAIMPRYFFDLGLACLIFS